MSDPHPKKTAVHVRYTCLGGPRNEKAAKLVEDRIRDILGSDDITLLDADQNGNADIWVMLDGSLPNTPAEIQIIEEYVGAVVKKGAGDPFAAVPVPIIVTMKPGRWQRSGFRFPNELLLPLHEVVGLKDRLAALQMLHGESADRPFSLAVFRDIMVGNFREMLGLDHSHHGTTSNLQNAVVDLKQFAQRLEALQEDDTRPLKIEEEKPLYIWGYPQPENLDPKKKVSNPLPTVFEKAAGERSIYHKLFPVRAKLLQTGGPTACMPEIEGLVAGLQEKRGLTKEDGEKIRAALRKLDRAFPRWRGHGLVSLPVTRLTGLVVDDQTEELMERLRQTPIESDKEESISMCEIVGFHPAYEKDKISDYTEALRDFLRNGSKNEMCSRCIDFVLLDLSFTAAQEAAGRKPGQGSWEDPLGWRLLPILRKWLPDIPIIIHSWFGSSTQVRLAYERGAHWFLAKDDDHKLPSHLFNLLEHPHWEREWKSHSGDFEFDLPSSFPTQDYHKYLWWQCMKHLPGDDIRIRLMGEGISGAITAKAWRRINMRFDRLPPIIIKIDQPFEMGMEFVRYNRFIDPYLSNRAGRIHHPPARADREHSAIAYTCAGSSQGMASHGRRTEVLSLLKLLEMNLPKDSGGVLPSEKYESLFRYLLEDTLPRIHDVDPTPDEDEPNPVFGEFQHPLNAYIARFPATKQIRLESPLLSPSDGGAGGIRLLFNEADAKSGTLDALELPKKAGGLVKRWSITGPLAAHYARHRVLRRSQIVMIQGEPVAAVKGGWREIPADCGVELAPWLADLPGFASKGVNVCDTIRQRLEEAASFLKSREKRFRGLRKGIIHGDLNLGNLMVERELGAPPVPLSDEAWLIDFAWTRRDAIAIDFAQLETDILIRLGREQMFQAPDGSRRPEWFAEFRDSYLESRWTPAQSVTSDPRREFLFRIMKQVREAADGAQINASDYEHVRLAALVLTAKLRIGKLGKPQKDTDDVFATALCLGWLFKQHALLKG